MEAGPALPPGVTPDMAARAYAWKWWMGARNHRASLARRAHRRARVYHRTLVGRWAILRAPYRAGEHPGASELLHALLSIAPTYGDRLIRGQTPLPANHAEQLARDLEAHYAPVSELIADLKRHASHRRAEIAKHVPRRRQPG